MPSYFYHISLELVPYSRNPETNDRQPAHFALELVREALLPFQRRDKSVSRGRRGERSDNSSENKSHSSRSSSSDAFGVVDASRKGTSQCSIPRKASPATTTDSSLRDHSPESQQLTSSIESDCRFDEISIRSIDMIDSERAPVAQGKMEVKDSDSNNNISIGIGTDILGGLHTKGRYIPLDQRVSDSVWGIVHLYRDAKETPGLNLSDYPPDLKGSAAARQPSDHSGRAGKRGVDVSNNNDVSTLSDEDCRTLCILAVPSYLSPSDFLGFVGERTMDDVSHFRMIRTARANRYMVLMRFRNGKRAREWQKEWNGKVFNSMEPETCHVVFVKSIEIQVAATSSAEEGSMLGSGSVSSSLAPSTLSAKPVPPPTPSLIELPTCPVCLERMDETTGLLTIICQHVFHCTCLQKWKGSGCPVCRYTLDDYGRRSQGVALEEGPAECSVCHSEQNLWICLICRHIGCGRYDQAHAFAHFKETSHAFAMDLVTHRVWDYVSDAYVHRIIQSKTDGKYVELPAADNSALDPPDWEDAVPREKLENMSVEYTHLLTSQLESQRAYFEEIVERAVDKASKAGQAASSAQSAAEQANAELRELQAKYRSLTEETIPSLERDKSRAERRAEKFEAMARKMEKEWREEKAMNENLLKKVELLTEEVAKLKATNADLAEQNRDLTFFISGSEKLKEFGEEAVEGTISIPENSGTSKKKGKGKRR